MSDRQHMRAFLLVHSCQVPQQEFPFMRSASVKTSIACKRDASAAIDVLRATV